MNPTSGKKKALHFSLRVSKILIGRGGERDIP